MTKEYVLRTAAHSSHSGRFIAVVSHYLTLWGTQMQDRLNSDMAQKIKIIGKQPKKWCMFYILMHVKLATWG